MTLKEFSMLLWGTCIGLILSFVLFEIAGHVARLRAQKINRQMTLLTKPGALKDVSKLTKQRRSFHD